MWFFYVFVTKTRHQVKQLTSIQFICGVCANTCQFLDLNLCVFWGHFLIIFFNVAGEI